MKASGRIIIRAQDEVTYGDGETRTITHYDDELRAGTVNGSANSNAAFWVSVGYKVVWAADYVDHIAQRRWKAKAEARKAAQN